MLCQVPDIPERIELEDYSLHFPFGNPTRAHSMETLHVQITFSTINKIKNLNLTVPTSTYQLSNITHGSTITGAQTYFVRNIPQK